MSTHVRFSVADVMVFEAYVDVFYDVPLAEVENSMDDIVEDDDD